MGASREVNGKYFSRADVRLEAAILTNDRAAVTAALGAGVSVDAQAQHGSPHTRGWRSGS